MALKFRFLVSAFFRSLIRLNVKEAWLTLSKRDTAIMTLPLLTKMKRRLAGESNKAVSQEKNYLSLQNFYRVMGTAAATLTGLMFVATSLVAGIETHVSTANAGISAFNTPTVVHFSIVFLLAGVLSAPWQTYSSLGLLLGLVGLGMVFYSIIILRRMRRVPHYQSTFEDWLWYMAFPFFANILLIVAAFVLSKQPSSALYIVGLAMPLLLLVGIRNTWDMVTFLAVDRAHSENENRNKNGVVREVGKTERPKNKSSK